jgi:putative ABC transport system substrate-binding protein
LAHPGGNITGLSMLLTELSVKELEMLTEAVPQVKRIAVMWNPTTPSHALALRAVEDGGEKLAVKLMLLPVRAADEFAGAFATMAREQAGGFVDIAGPLSASSSSSWLPRASGALKGAWLCGGSNISDHRESWIRQTFCAL